MLLRQVGDLVQLARIGMRIEYAVDRRVFDHTQGFGQALRDRFMPRVVATERFGRQRFQGGDIDAARHLGDARSCHMTVHRIERGPL